MTRATAETVFEMLTGEDDGRVCRDIPDSACREQPRNFLTHVVALGASKAADGLADAKLVLAWLLTVLGAPAGLVGLLVPVREAGSLLPQLLIAGSVRAQPRRKYVWTVGALGEGVAALGMVVAALTLEGAAAGWAILGLLLVLAVSRSLCSVSYKDVLGKTVDRERRGRATGAAQTLGSVAVLILAVLLLAGVADRLVLVLAALAIAGGLWLAAAGLFVGLAEEAGATDGGGNPIATARANLPRLWNDAALARFIRARALLTASALAPPWMVAAASGTAGQIFEQLGALVLASALAALASAFVWGRLADHSSRLVLAGAAALTAATLGLSVLAQAAGVLGSVWVLAPLVFGIMIAHQGVRLGRSTHLVDMAEPDLRAVYTALSNTVIGVILVLGGLLALVAELAGTGAVLALLAAMAAAAIPASLALDELQARAGR